MSQVIPFATGNLPAHIAARAKNRSNNALTSHVGNGGYPVLSIKGKVFTLVKQDERKIITRELDGEQVPAAALEIVIVAANPNLSKVWYAKGFDEDAKNAKPDCFSNDGIKPDVSVEKPQSKKCLDCPKNAWGSGQNGKGKACGDSRRVAIAAPDQINEPMLLRVPAASLKPLAEYGKKLDNRGTSFDSVVTKIKFDMEEATPKLVFIPVGFLGEDQLNAVDEAAKSDKVQQIIGLQASPEHEALPAPEAKAEDDDGFGAFDKATQAPVEEAPAPKKKAAKVVEDDELDAAIAPAKAKKVEAEDAEAETPKKKTVVKVTDDLDSDLDALLGELDD